MLKRLAISFGLVVSPGFALVVEAGEPTLAAAFPKAVVATPPTAPTDATAESADTPLQLGSVPAAAREVIEERFPSGKVKIRREVTQDAEENYLNDGSWTCWDEHGTEIAHGQLALGKKQGQWIRKYGSLKELNFPLPSTASQFQPPFVSQATFQDDKLEGEWIITDAKERLIICWTFEHGVRQGVSTCWYPNKTKWREVGYRDGKRDGASREWTPEQRLVKDEIYSGSRKFKLETVAIKGRGKQSETQMLGPVESAGVEDEWWTASSHELPGAGGLPERHGTWTMWHTNEMKAGEGQYKDGQPDGPFRWWHANGQIACEGIFTQGQPNGAWTWWFDNGQKRYQGAFVDGRMSGKWVNWDESGHVVASNRTGSDKSTFAFQLDLKGGPPQLVTLEHQLPEAPPPIEPAQFSDRPSARGTTKNQNRK